MKVNCNICGIEVNKKPYNVKKYKIHYCSIKCRTEGNTKSIEVDCACCGKKMIRKQHEYNSSKTGNLFCSKSCSAKISNENRAGFGISRYRDIAFKEKEKKCEVCGYEKIKGILVVHHIDRDRTNSNISNLKVLCPNCHHEEHFNMRDGMFRFST